VCQPLDVPEFGSLSCSSATHRLGAKCTFSCDPGYILLGASESTCVKAWYDPDQVYYDNRTPVCLEMNPEQSTTAQQGPQTDSTTEATTVGKPGKAGKPGEKGEKGDVGATAEIEDLKKTISDLQLIVSRLQKSGHCPLGMEYGFITDSQLSASSSFSNGHAAHRARLNTRNNDVNNDRLYVLGDDIGGWHPRSDYVGSWIQVDLLNPIQVTGIITQGRGPGDQWNQWIRTYKILYGDDENNLEYIQTQDGSHKILAGNSDRYSKVVNFFPAALTTRYIRIEVVEYNSAPVLRFELLGC